MVAQAGMASDGGSFYGGGDAVRLTVSEYEWQHFAPVQMCLGDFSKRPKKLLPELSVAMVKSWMPF